MGGRPVLRSPRGWRTVLPARPPTRPSMCCPAPGASPQHVVQTVIDGAGAVEGLRGFKYLDERGKDQGINVRRGGRGGGRCRGSGGVGCSCSSVQPTARPIGCPTACSPPDSRFPGAGVQPRQGARPAAGGPRPHPVRGSAHRLHAGASLARAAPPASSRPALPCPAHQPTCRSPRPTSTGRSAQRQRRCARSCGRQAPSRPHPPRAAAPASVPTRTARPPASRRCRATAALWGHAWATTPAPRAARRARWGAARWRRAARARRTLGWAPACPLRPPPGPRPPARWVSGAGWWGLGGPCAGLGT